ncbi:carboxypeptidase-like regulatory domain-containing protein [Ekhidna sp.]|uniref:carboxypeptidase-like regulatory domain-containing protein n=1 Tax=Ekhidna sp. TaxID=2608089 RepID=UPI003B58DF5D
MPIKITILLVFLAQSFLVHSQGNKSGSNTYNYLIEPGKAEGLLTLKGRVLDQSKQGVPFVNIGIRGTLYGTAADNQGYFTLILPSSLDDQIVTISCVGFQSMTLPVTELKKKYQFVLNDDISQLADIEVKSERITARDVIKGVIRRIPDNYSQEPYTQMKLYRQKVKIENGGLYIVEKIEEEYDDNGYESSGMYSLRKNESFRLIHQCRIGKLDTTTGKVSWYRNYKRDFPTHTAWSDAVNVRFNNFLSNSKYKKYDFQFNERGLTSKDTIYIDFSINNPGHRSTTALDPLKFSGSILVDANTYAVLEVQTLAVLDKVNMLKAKTYRSYKDNSEPVWWEKEIVKYKKVEEYYFLGSFQRLSNWDQNADGFIEIIGLNVSSGEREKQESSRNPQEEYNPKKWETFIQSNQ